MPSVLKNIEGYYKQEFDKLKNINNLGTIPSVLEMANYPKYEHSQGTLYQIEQLLDITDNTVIPKTYRSGLRIAAIFMHTGHLPFTFSTERAVLIAANMGDRDEVNAAEQYVQEAINTVSDTAGLSQATTTSIRTNIMQMREYKHFYRVLSAKVICNKWRQIKSRLDISTNDLGIAVKDLVDIEDDGYKWLSLASKADYVQRDALYLGTVRIDISPPHLFGDLTEYEPQFSVNEERLIESGLEYLRDRFYNHHDVRWFSTLYEKIMARVILSSKFKIQWLRSYNDEKIKRIITRDRKPNGEKANLPTDWVERGRKLFNGEYNFQEALTVRNFKYDGDIIDLEYYLTNKRESRKGLLAYPFNRDLIIDPNYSESNGDSDMVRMADENIDVFDVSLFTEESISKLSDIMNVLSRISDIGSINHHREIKRCLSKFLSWTGKYRVDNIDVLRSLSLAVEECFNDNDDFVDDMSNNVSSIKTYSQIWRNDKNLEWFLLTRNTSIYGIDKDTNYPYLEVVRGLLNMPLRLLQFKSVVNYINTLKEKLSYMYFNNTYSVEDGDIFEAFCLLDKITERKGDFQTFINGLVVRDISDSGKRDINEFDIILLTLSGSDVKIDIYACTKDDTAERDNVEQITTIADEINSSFPELSIATYYATPNEGENLTANYEDPGRGYNRGI